MQRRKQTTRYIPDGSSARPHPDGEAVGIVYTYTSAHSGILSAIAYQGKAIRSTWHYVFKTPEAMERAITAWFHQLSEGARAKAERKAERAAQRATPHTLEVGSIVYNSWGWEQTNIDFYQVTRTSANYVWLRPLAADTVETGFMCGHKTPHPGQFLADSEETQHRVEMWNGEPTINFKYGAGCVWGGKPVACSWYG